MLVHCPRHSTPHNGRSSSAIWLVINSNIIKDNTMITELMEVYSIEEGDIIIVNDDFYHVVGTDYADEGDDLHVLTLVDEEGNGKTLVAPGRSELRIVVNEYV
jgi:hypothetical protein